MPLHLVLHAPLGQDEPQGLSWSCCVLGLECLELDVEIGLALDPCLSPMEDCPPSHAHSSLGLTFLAVCLLRIQCAGNSLSYNFLTKQCRLWSPQNLNLGDDCWRALALAVSAGPDDSLLSAWLVCLLSQALSSGRLPQEESQPHLKAGSKDLVRCRCHT